MEFHWWMLPLVWWAGMLPASWAAGVTQSEREAKGEKPHPDAAVILFVIGWPVYLVLFPIMLVHMAAQRRKQRSDGKKNGDDTRGNSKR